MLQTRRALGLNWWFTSTVLSRLGPLQVTLVLERRLKVLRINSLAKTGLTIILQVVLCMVGKLKVVMV